MQRSTSLFHTIITTIVVSLVGIAPIESIIASEVNIYSARQESLIKPLLDRFTQKTGINVNMVTSKGDALLTRLRSEGMNSPADLLLTVDAGRLYRAQEAGVLQAVESFDLNNKIPSHLRSLDGQWYGLSVRARVLVYAKDRVQPSELSSYEALSEPTWKGRVCIRSSSNIYNQSLVASLVKNNGKKATAEWAKGIVSNMARDSKGNDRAQILAVAAGEADLAVANTYYYALMLSGKKGAEQQAAAKKVLPFFPNQGDRGTHMNISGGGILKTAPNPDNAKKLLEFLLTKEAQSHIVNNTFEYPMIDGVEPHDLVKQMGLGYNQDLKTKVVNYGKNQATALECMLAANWK